MQSTVFARLHAVLCPAEQTSVLSQTSLQSLAAVFATMPDPRSRHGQRYPLWYLLTCLVAALLCHANSMDAVGQWCAEQRALLADLFPGRRFLTPTGSLYRRLLSRLDAAALEGCLAQWTQASLQGEAPVALDGKTVRGAGAAGQQAPHLLSVSTHDQAETLAQVPVGAKTNEIPVAQALLPSLPLTGRVCTADALHTQIALAQQIISQGADYVFVVKENQPHLVQALEWYFAEPLPGDAQAQTRDRARGRIEVRSIAVTTALRDYLADWPGIEQQARLTRTITREGKTTTETVYLITSASPARVDAERLLALTRGHWSIESRHWIRDTVFGEDASALRTGTGPQILAAFRNLVITLIRRLGTRAITATRRHFSAHPEHALALLLAGYHSS